MTTIENLYFTVLSNPNYNETMQSLEAMNIEYLMKANERIRLDNFIERKLREREENKNKLMLGG